MILMQTDLWGEEAPLPKRFRFRRFKRIGVDESPRYPKRRPRRCAYCNAWFRPPTPFLPEHMSGGAECPGSKRRERSPLVVEAGANWRERAACLGADAQLFYVVADGPVSLQALAYCQRCPVLANCFDWAMNDTAFSGIAGGVIMTPRLRRQLRLMEEDDDGRLLAAESADAAQDALEPVSPQEESEEASDRSGCRG